MRVRDREPEAVAVERRRFYTVESLGEKRHLTPEGFLVCEDVPIARTGEQIYGAFDGVPIAPGPDGRIYVMRTEAEVFRPETMASANGKDVVDEHPDDDVIPANWRALTCGCALNIRRGEGAKSDLLIADLMVKDQAVIDMILAGKREISLGYDAEYIATGLGKGEQRNILINHIALVDRGRCGSRCSIGDRIPIPEPVKTADCSCQHQETSMPKTLKARVIDALKKAGGWKDEEMEKIADTVEGVTKDEEGAGALHLHIGPAGEQVSDSAFCTKDEFTAHVAKNDEEHAAMRDSIESMKAEMAASKEPSEAEKTAAKDEAERKASESEMKDEATEEKKEEATKAKDSAFLEDSYQQTLADAEILFPGVQPVSTFDSAAPAVRTFKDGIIALRRRTLDLYYNTAEGRSFIDQQLMGKPFNVRDEAGMPSKTVTSMFRGAVAMKRTLNNSKAGGGQGQARTSDINPQNRPSFSSIPVITADQLAKDAAAAWGPKN